MKVGSITPVAAATKIQAVARGGLARDKFLGLVKQIQNPTEKERLTCLILEWRRHRGKAPEIYVGAQSDDGSLDYSSLSSKNTSSSLSSKSS
jgi:hypothetical protein